MDSNRYFIVSVDLMSVGLENVIRYLDEKQHPMAYSLCASSKKMTLYSLSEHSLQKLFNTPEFS